MGRARRADAPLSNAFGFGGINAHLIVEAHPSADARASAVPIRAGHTATPAEDVLALAGADADGLLAQLEAWERSPGPTKAFPAAGRPASRSWTPPRSAWRSPARSSNAVARSEGATTCGSSLKAC